MPSMIIFRTISIPFLVGFCYFFYKRPFDQLPNKYLFFLLFFLKCFISIFVHEILNMPYPNDALSYYHHALETLNGKIPTIDFQTPYSVGFEYLIASAVWVYQSTISVILLFHIAEFMGIYLIIKGLGLKSNRKLNQFLWLYFFNPLLFNWLGLGGQDESLLVLIFGIFFYLIQKPQNQIMGYILGIASLLLTKIFSFFIIAAYFLKQSTKQKIIFALSLIITLSLIQFGLKISIFSTEFSRNHSVGDDLSKLYTSGNLWFLLKLVGIDLLQTKLPILFSVLGLGIYSIIHLLQTEKANQGSFTKFTIAYFLIYGILYKMTFPQYLVVAVIGLLLLYIFAQKPINLILFLSWSGLLSIDGTLFYFLNTQHANLLQTPFYIFYQLLVVGGNLYFFWKINGLSKITFSRN
jgi:hypothetical protein